MPDWVLPCLSGLARYAVLCLIAVLCGRGLLRLCRLRLAEEAELLFAPVLTFLSWTLVLGVAVGLRCAVKDVTPWLGGASLVLAVVGLWRPWPRWQLVAPLLLCLGLPVVTMGQTFSVGMSEHLGTLDCDGWAYMAAGRYFWDYPRGAEGDFAPVHQYGTVLKDVRYMSSVYVGFLSPLYEVGDPFGVTALYKAWVLFTTGAAVYLFCVADKQNAWRAAATTVFAVLSGWISNLLWANNLDNTLCVAFMPVLAGILILWETRQLAKWVLLGVALAGLLYVYAEAVPNVLVPAVLIALPRCWPARGERRLFLVGASLALLGALLLWEPVAKMTVAHLVNVSSITKHPPGSRPGDPWFAGMSDPKVQWSALWGLGGETLAKRYRTGMNQFGIGLTVLLLLGAVKLVRERRWGVPLAATFLLCGAAYALFHLRYEYFAYKVLALSWWCLVLLLVAGAGALVTLFSARALRVALALALFVPAVVVSFKATRVKAPLWASAFHFHRGADFRAVQAVAPTLKDGSILLCANDWVPNLLGLYLLKDTPFYPAVLAGFPGVPENRAMILSGQVAPLRSTRYVLSDTHQADNGELASCADLVWSSRGYNLWKVGDRAKALVCWTVNDVSGIQRDAAGPFCWVGNRDTVLYVYAAHAGHAQVQATFVTGPASQGKATWNVEVGTDTGHRSHHVLNTDQCYLTVPVCAGMNAVTLKVLDKPTQPVANGVGQLVMGMWKWRAVLLEEGTGVESEARKGQANKQKAVLDHVWNDVGGVQEDKKGKLFWIGDNETVVSVGATQPGHVRLEANFVPGQSLPEKAVRNVEVISDTGYRSQHVVSGGKGSLSVPVHPGMNSFALRVLDKPTQPVTPTSPRPLLLGVENLRIRATEAAQAAVPTLRP